MTDKNHRDTIATRWHNAQPVYIRFRAETPEALLAIQGALSAVGRHTLAELHVSRIARGQNAYVISRLTIPGLIVEDISDEWA